LITSFAAYANYQQQRGSNTAWTWEHQAMTRARCVLGDASLHERFDAVRKAVISAPRDADSLRAEIAAMRERMASAHPVKADKFDIKYSPGGMIDAEFVMQFLVLSQSGAHPELMANAGNIALLERAEALGLLPAGLGHNAASAYRAMRQVQHKARLDETSTQLPAHTMQTEQDAILALWHQVFTPTPSHP
jgi:glutamate-ammonia-ligase adenylyltransferase